ncbi:hypothetical protein HQ531_06400 [bacterium]|nr:hypothetical protein [bacterium]
MRYLLLLAVAYYVFKLARKLLSNLKIIDTDSEDIRGKNEEARNRLRVDEADIEDADFKDVD